MAPPTKRGASTIAVLRAARAELERATEVVDFDARRKAVCDWARGLGYKEWAGIPTHYQRWREGVIGKFARQTKGLDDGGPPEGYQGKSTLIGVRSDLLALALGITLKTKTLLLPL